jgi:ATP-dependent helicase/nuclease subunit A
VVLAVADLPGAAAVTGRMNDEQREAVTRRGHVFVSAGAGTGKTAVLVERILHLFADGTPVDRVLAITFTDRAASELRRRVREGLELAGEMDKARRLDGAWISTIHRFCLRVLRAHAFEAGLDPRFAVADDASSRMLLQEAFDVALERFVSDGPDRRLDLLAAYGRRRLRPIVLDAHARLRSGGAPLELRPYSRADLDAARAAALSAARELPEVDEARALVALVEGGTGAAELADLSAQRVRNTAAHRDYNAARRALEDAARDVAAVDDLGHVEALVRLLDAGYQELKDARGLVDFADLELRARALLADHPDVAAAYRDRFASVLVDEFQDTNRLQCELIDLVAGGELFLVGDEFQSIYRFRHADVEVYRERRGAAGDGAITLHRNHRSQQHVIDAVNEVFRRDFGARYSPLTAAAEQAPAPADGRVELLLTDKSACREAGEAWRDLEAREIARRVAELVDTGECTPGQVVLLFEAGTDAARYEAALRERHLRTVRAAGRGYYATQQVADLLGYLRLLRNRYDDVALLTVLASPLVGLSNAGLLWVRRAAVRRPIFTALERDEPPAGLSAEEHRLVLAFLQRFARLVKRSGEVSLERLCELIVAEHDYDLAALVLPDGDRRFANLRKLGRLAAEFEAVRGPDLEGFIRFCDEQSSLAAREGEAAIAEEGRDAVVLMTVHAAKGLEFDVVVLADQGRERAARQLPDILVSADGRAALRAPDAGGMLKPALGYEQAAERERSADREEGRRLQYVAMTRARRHLILSGALEPGEETSIAEVCGLLEVGLEDGGDAERGDARLRVAVARPEPSPNGRPAPSDAAAEGDPVGSQLSLFSEGGRLPARLDPLAPVPAAAAVPLRRLSYSALSIYRRCGYRYYAQRILGLPEPAVPQVEGAGLRAVEIGDAVHLELERADGRWRDLYPNASAEDSARIEAFLAAWGACGLRERVAGLPSVRPEVPFAFDVDGVLFRGRFDLFGGDADGGAVVVDFKTNRLGDRTAQEIMDASYGVQVTTYALAALRSGAPSVDVAYAFLERSDAVAERRFEAADAAGLEAQLREAIDAIRGGRFPARPGPHCQECPALGLLCAGPALEWQE